MCANQTERDGVRPLVTGNRRICPDSAVARLRCEEKSVREGRGPLPIRAILAGRRSNSRGRRLVRNLRRAVLRMDLGQPDGVNVAEEVARDRTGER